VGLTGSSYRGGAARVLTCVAIACATLLAHGQMNTSSAASSGRLRVPNPDRARVFTLGFEPLIADYYWIQALQIAGDRKPPPDANRTIFEIVDFVTELDPWVDHPYRFAALWLIESPEEVRQANHLLQRGIAYHPDEWRNRFYLGYNLFFFLEENARAADVLERAIVLPGAPDYLGAFVTRLRASSDSLDTAALFLQKLIAQAEDEYTKAEYLKAHDEIETERRARFLDGARAEFWKRHGRDIREPSELWEGPLRVIGRMPLAHPHFPGFVWELEQETQEIVSSYYGGRYHVHVHPLDAERQRKWRGEAADGEEGAVDPVQAETET
jgi:tetratricopeptide (TPR) repeat protein